MRLHRVRIGSSEDGDHTSHSPQKFVPWDGKSKISYTDNKAFVYLTGDVSRSETLNVPGNKELTICLNGYKIKKTPIDDPQGNRVMNINSGGKLRLCDCSAMQTGVITGGSHQMGGGIHNGGTLVMYGGKIMNNEASYGGGLWNNCHNNRRSSRNFEKRENRQIKKE